MIFCFPESEHLPVCPSPHRVGKAKKIRWANFAIFLVYRIGLKLLLVQLEIETR